MRNYIHCMLCGSMFTAQLLYTFGINKTENEVYCDCPQFPSLSCIMQAVCSAIAVLLHYLYLVMFMWMLMEGVVLYVKLVKVFTVDHKCYIAFFTIASYGK